MKQIKGIPASSGQVSAKASVISTLDEIVNFRNGNILVTKVTSPDWTPLIYASSGVITELGGSLSHAAIICREYGIPAIVGVKDLMEQIRDGEMIKIDGGKGIIIIED